MPKENVAVKDRRERLGSVLDRISSGRFVITAEQTQASQGRAYRRMVDRGVVDAVTLPDLPAIGRFRDLLSRRRLVKKRPSGRIEQRIAETLSKTAEPVFTVSASLRTAGMVARRVAAARAGGAVALLVLSGGGLLRRLASIVKLGWLLPQSSFRILCSVRRAYPSQMLWAVENPILPDPAARARRMQSKVDAGAGVILTQPPFLWGRFSRWLVEVRALGMTTPVICGVPIITSSLSLRTWMFLVGLTGGHGEIEMLLARLRKAEERGQGTEEGIRYTVELLRRLQTTPGVAGVHMMPIFAWRRMEKVLGCAGLAPSDRLEEDARAG